MQCFMMVGC